MPTARSSVTVRAKIDDVFNFIADYRNIPTIQPQFTSVQLASQVERGQGAVIELRGTFRGMPMRARNRIVTFTPPRRLVSISEGTVTSRNAWEFTSGGEDGNETHVTLTIDYKVGGGGLLSGLFTGVASSLFHSEIQGMIEESLRRLKECVKSDE